MNDEEVEQAYIRYGPLVLRRCRLILRNEAAADDARQEVFLQLWRYGSAFAGADSKLGWLYQVAKNCCFDHLSRKATRPLHLLDEHKAHEPRVPSHAQRVEDEEWLFKFLAEFDEKTRKITLLYYYYGMGQAEIADALGCTRQTVVNRLAPVKARIETLRGSLHE